MSSASPYYLPAASRLRELEARVRQSLPGLLERWWVRSCEVREVRIGALDEPEPFAPERVRYLARSGEQLLALTGAERSWLTLAEGWLGCHVGGAGQLVQTLERAFCADLFQALARTETAPAVMSDVAWAQIEDAALRPGAGGLRLELTLGDAALTLVLNAALLGAGAWPEPAAPRRALRACNEVLEATRVRMAVHLPAVQVPLTAVAALAVGDFLNLRQDLSGRVEMRGEQVDVQLSGSVGCVHGRKAVLLEDINRP